MTAWIQDLRTTFRTLRKSPLFTGVAVLSLGLGIGAATAIFALVNGVLLRSLPVPRAGELRTLSWSGQSCEFRSYWGAQTNTSATNREGNAFSMQTFEGLREAANGSGQVIACQALDRLTVTFQGHARFVDAMLVSPGFFQVLELQSARGSLESGNNENIAWISHRYWEDACNADQTIVGQLLSIKGRAFTIGGVLPVGFLGLEPGQPTSVYFPITQARGLLPSYMPDPSMSSNWWLKLMARVQPGAEGTFQTRLDAAISGLAKDHFKAARIMVRDGRTGPGLAHRPYREMLWTMLAAAGLVLLVACANLSGLSLVRGAARRHDFAVRAALGASRYALMRLVLIEGVLISCTGAIIGLWFALGIRDGLARLMVGRSEGLTYDISLSPAVLAFTLGLALLTAILSALLPALRAAQADPLSGLKTRANLGAQRLRLGRSLLAGQLALSLLLLAGAGLLLRSVSGLLRIQPGFKPENLLLLGVDPTGVGHAKDTARFHERVVENLKGIAGVQHVALVQYPLLSGSTSSCSLGIHGTDIHGNTGTFVVGDGFFETYGVPLLAGRSLNLEDTKGTRPVIVVNEAFVRSYLADRNPLGQRVESPYGVWEIVGVCGDCRPALQKAAEPMAYFSFRQRPLEMGFYALRTDQAPLAYAASAQKAIASVDQAVPIFQITTQEEVRDRTILQQRLLAALGGFLALFSLLLSCIGLYGLMAFQAGQRRGEIGLRMALGAQASHIQWMMLRETLQITGAGIIIGLGFSYAGTRVLASLLYGVKPMDPLTFVAMTLVLMVVAIGACWSPVRRASKENPADTLRTS